MTHFNHDVQFGICRHRYHEIFPPFCITSKKKPGSDLEHAEKRLKSRTSHINRLVFICMSKSPLSFTRHRAPQSSGSLFELTFARSKLLCRDSQSCKCASPIDAKSVCRLNCFCLLNRATRMSRMHYTANCSGRLRLE